MQQIRTDTRTALRNCSRKYKKKGKGVSKTTELIRWAMGYSGDCIPKLQIKPHTHTTGGAFAR